MANGEWAALDEAVSLYIQARDKAKQLQSEVERLRRAINEMGDNRYAWQPDQIDEWRDDTLRGED